MGSSRPSDRFIGEATFLPQWMKGKLDTRFDYTDSTFSPPADDNFFYIRYPKQEATSTPSTTNSNEGFISINKLFGNKIDLDRSTSTKLLYEQNNSTNNKNTHSSDYSKHLLSSQQLTPFSTNEGNGPKVVVANSIKSKQHSDDEFRNEKITESSRSIVYVANQIMSCKFGKFNTSEASSSAANQNQANELPTQQQRKGSKSLPVTPIASPSVSPDSSPKSRRRQRLFHESERGRNGWLLSSILGQSRELIAPKIAEEDEQQMEQIPQRALSRKKSISSQNLTYFGTEDKATGNKEVAASSTTHLNLLQAKPSEFREMNFWSPTSM
ncbi:PREDICTED: uncharacterized protein LOC105367765 isoform X1 [Ceratosolen solmsi marchali]|uniref:Uncharacterized protein LOC105367765 isoform X1 n=1 Tax=Ceratosolen solmsi marchali TaxID=326594 RepID=A0AAJ6YUZ3_9HYME|nr:PREDICTED: uncharacterized protein LOC105367765 isoform X1 [Ceratosolen solmsi marchali]